MPNYPSVLIAAPQNIIKRYCWEDWVYNIESFSYPNFNLLLVDNSDDGGKFKKEIAERGAIVSHIKPKNKSVAQLLAESMEEARQMCLRNKYEYLFSLETDIIPPRSIIEMLVAAKRKVIGAMYHIGHGHHSRPMIQLQEPHYHETLRSVYDLKDELITFLDGNIKPVYHCGLGCVLIHRSILEKIKFRYIPGQNYYPDTYFAQDVNDMGERIYVDTSIIVEHRNIAHRVTEFETT